MQHFSGLKVWERSHALVLAIYRLTAAFPPIEKFGLVSQLRRAAASVPTNIAEGSKRRGSQDYSRFLNIAEGSLAEAEYLLVLSRDLGYITETKSKPLLLEISEIARMLNGLRSKVESEAAA